ncbi:DNA/RNA helicase domain-containing protein [Streptomyces bungoensis]|uniref:DNA/RNA helicase domain-containing protein n=1 Tax=Streptomyces bungoensis TaxID=285568 RepID=UPI003CC52A43
MSGGPGSGKTALAVRLLGRLMRAHPATRPRFITPSGTLRAHLLDAVRSHGAARELFPSAGSLRSTARQTGALVIDEAQRIKRGSAAGLPPDLAAVLQHVPPSTPPTPPPTTCCTLSSRQADPAREAAPDSTESGAASTSMPCRSTTAACRGGYRPPREPAAGPRPPRPAPTPRTRASPGSRKT